jgi:hypothetical protein
MKCPKCGGKVVEIVKKPLNIKLEFCIDIKECNWSRKVNINNTKSKVK